MKKLFNYALLAAALLIGVNVNAATTYYFQVDGSKYTTLTAALDASKGSEDITQLKTYTLPVGTYDFNNVTLNANGYNLTCKATGDYTIKNATITGTSYAVYQVTAANNIVLDNVTITTTGTHAIYNNIAAANLSLVNGSSASLKMAKAMTSISVEDGSSLELVSGTFTNVSFTGLENCTVQAGTFALDVQDDLVVAPDKYAFYASTTTCKVLKSDTAKAEIVGGHKYLTFANAWTRANENDEIKMLADATTYLTLTKSITIDLNGHNILGTSNKSIFTLSTEDKSLKLVNEGAAATITTQRSNTTTYYVATLTKANTSIEVVGDITMDASATTGSNSCINMGVASAKAIIDGATVGIYANKGSDILVKEGSHATIVAGSLIDCKLANGTNIASTVLIGGGFYGFIPEITLPAGLTYAESWCEELGDCYEVQENKIASINGGEAMTLADAFTEAQDGDIIKIIGAGVEVAQGSTAYLNEAKEITLDLNGKTLVFNHPEANGYINARMIAIGKGILHIKNGTMLNNTEVNSEYKTTKGGTAGIIFMTGETDRNSNAMENYSTQLFVEEGVVLDCQYGKSAVEVYDYVGLVATNKHMAYGVYANIAGKVHGEKYGMQISGQVNVVPAEGEDAREYNYPWFVIEKTGEVVSNPETTKKGGVGIYMGGFGILDIYGYVHGATGVYVKNGDVKIEDAIIVSDYTGDFAPAINEGSSVEGGGSAIVIVTNKNTYGNIDVTISGDTKIEGGSGYAIEEDVNFKGEEGKSQIDAIDIEGGTIVSGKEGGIVIQDETQEHLEVIGGITSGTVEVGKPGEETDEVSIETFVPTEGENKGHVTEIKDEEGNVIAVVVTKGDEPEKVTLVESDDIMEYEGKSINFNGSTTQQELTDDLNLQELSMVDATNEEKLVVPDDVTLHVEKLIMGPNASIVVAQGGTLIVDGEQGIVAQADGNITIEAQEGKMGQFLFNPEVTSNRHPVATVHLVSHSFGNAQEEDYMNQFFGMPMVKVNEITMDKGQDVAARFSIWRYDHWETVGYINRSPAINYSKFDIPFGICDIASNNFENDWITFDITGELLGNTDPNNFRILKGWTSAANAWTGNCDVAALQDRIADLEEQGVKQYVYNYEYKDHVVTWNAIDEILNPQTTIAPLQPIMLCSDGEAFASNVMNYNELVWNPAKDNMAKAPRQSVDMNAVAVRVTAENGVSDAMAIKEAPEFEGGKNAPKYMNEVLCVYANTDEKLAVLASDNVDNTIIGLNCDKAGKYIVSFYNVRGENFVLIDLVNNARIEMTEGVTYEFYAEAGENAHRFMVVEGAKAPTNNEKVNGAVKAMKVISGSEFRIVKEGHVYNGLGAEL